SSRWRRRGQRTSSAPTVRMVTGRGSFSRHRPSAARSCSGERATTPSLKPRLRLVRFIGPSTAGTRGRRTRISTRGSSESTKSSTRGSRSCASSRCAWESSRLWTSPPPTFTDLHQPPTYVYQGGGRVTEPQIFGTHEPKTLEQLRDVASRADRAPTDHPLFEDPAWEAVPDRHERDRLRAKARSQLGTVGSGNHYVDVFADDADRIWVGVHFGSRGFGFGVAHGFLALGQNRAWGERVPERETLLDVTSPVGDAYWQLMNLAGRYAYAGREWVTRKVVELLGGREQELVHNHHNFAWREEHGGEPFYVVRKGATPAFPGQKGFVGGSMGDDAVIIQGVASDSAEVRDLQARALYSTVHGAGRVMSRTAAAGKRTRRG